jgi:hypothetical protein
MMPKMREKKKRIEIKKCRWLLIFFYRLRDTVVTTTVLWMKSAAIFFVGRLLLLLSSSSSSCSCENLEVVWFGQSCVLRWCFGRDSRRRRTRSTVQYCCLRDTPTPPYNKMLPSLSIAIFRLSTESRRRKKSIEEFCSSGNFWLVHQRFWDTGENFRNHSVLLMTWWVGSILFASCCQCGTFDDDARYMTKIAWLDSSSPLKMICRWIPLP